MVADIKSDLDDVEEVRRCGGLDGSFGSWDGVEGRWPSG